MAVSSLHLRLECRPRDVPDPGCGNLAFLEHALAGRSRVESLVVVCVASPRASRFCGGYPAREPGCQFKLRGARAGLNLATAPRGHSSARHI